MTRKTKSFGNKGLKYLKIIKKNNKWHRQKEKGDCGSHGKIEKAPFTRSFRANGGAKTTATGKRGNETMWRYGKKRVGRKRKESSPELKLTTDLQYYRGPKGLGHKM